MIEDRDWQRLDKWLWCARVLRNRVDCAKLVRNGSVRINRQPTDKPHARLRPGDVLTLPVGGQVRVMQVRLLALRRGPASEARTLYDEIEPSAALLPAPPFVARLSEVPSAAALAGTAERVEDAPCASGQSPSYAAGVGPGLPAEAAQD